MPASRKPVPSTRRVFRLRISAEGSAVTTALPRSNRALGTTVSVAGTCLQPAIAATDTNTEHTAWGLNQGR